MNNHFLGTRSDNRRISNICRLTAIPVTMRMKAGFLENSSRFRLNVYSLPAAQHYSGRPGTSPRTLGETLGVPAQALASSSGRLRRFFTVLQPRLRRQLAYKLAALYLQLQSTPWLPSGFEKQSVYFLRRNQPGSEEDFTVPFISHAFVPGCNNARDSSPNASISSVEVPEMNADGKARSLLSPTEGLFDLGKLLIELALDSPLEDLYEPGDMVGGDLSVLTQLCAARRLLDEVYEVNGRLYGDAVRRCIDGVDIREKSVARPEFRRAFCKDVVGKLQDTCNFWTGDTL
jgi:hypothetical protein